MTNEQLFNAIGAAEETLLADSERTVKKSRVRLERSAVAAALLLAFCACIPLFVSHRNRIPLSDRSVNVTARYVSGHIAEDIVTTHYLLPLTEEELISDSRTDVFRGTVTRMREVELNFNGSKSYRTRIDITVEAVYRGGCTEGEEIAVLLPCSVADSVVVEWESPETGELIEDFGKLSALKVGTTGIFMPNAYTESSVIKRDGAVLYLQDIADYGFLDVARYVFLETDNGLLFARAAYPSIAANTTLEQVEAFLKAAIAA